MRKGWTEKDVQEYLSDPQIKELMELAAEHGVMTIPPWMNNEELREYVMNYHLVHNPEMTAEEIEKEIKEAIQLVHEFESGTGNWVEVGDKQYILALTDPEALKEDLRQQYRRVFKDMTDEEIERTIEQEVEAITEGAMKRFGKQS